MSGSHCTLRAGVRGIQRRRGKMSDLIKTQKETGAILQALSKHILFILASQREKGGRERREK